MDSACATLNGRHLAKVSEGIGRNRTSGFWGESTRGSVNTKRFLSVQSCKTSRTNRNLRNSKPGSGIARAVLTSDIDEDSMAFQGVPTFEKPEVDPKSVASIILGGGAGTRLFPLTGRRAKPAVPIGGCYRLIDIPMSNCINSGIRKIFILTQFNSFSLNRHLSRAYSFGNGMTFGDGFVEVLAATQTPGEAGKKWFQGTADADAKNKNVEHILILSGDHLYRMDYMDFVQRHVDTNADITVSCVPMDDSRASDYGLMKIDKTGRIIQFAEKPKGSDLKAMAYLFNDYWEDIGTIKSFFDANLALTEQPPKFEFYDPKTPFFTSPRFLPPTKVEKCKIVDAIISHGCFLRECSVQHSIVGVRSRLESGVELQDTMMMGADYYQTEYEIASLVAEGKVPIGVGANTKIRNCIIDKNAKIGRNVIIANTDGVQEADRAKEGFYIRSGITVTLKNATIKDGTVI
ncbi:hypothetical protein JHK85_014599 [Glycine max]|nr:hypothetical protein JHK85_014599 [Glycine max]